MRFWQSLSFTEMDQLVDLARICEDVGFHGVFVSDHLFHPERLVSKYPYSEDGSPPYDAATDRPQPWAAICAMAAVTTRLHFNTGVYIAPLRHPLVVAKSLATASVLSRGRVALGVGVGWSREEFDQLGEDFHTRGRRLDEMIEVLRKVWTGDMVEHHGTHYDFDRLRMMPKPVSRIPIQIGGSSGPALRRAARNDGWIGSGDDPEELALKVARLRDLRREAGRDDGEFDVIAAVTAPPDVGLYHRLEDEGVTGMVSYPLLYSIGPGTTLDRKRRALEGYANDVIARY
jgi:probable F420-dependent oxidoreductase